jgi:hypothetical protein
MRVHAVDSDESAMTAGSVGHGGAGEAYEERVEMTGTRDDFLSTARSAADLLGEPAVAAAWSRPSVLPEFSVGGLAGRLAYQILAVPQALTGPGAVPAVSVGIPSHRPRPRARTATLHRSSSRNDCP